MSNPGVICLAQKKLKNGKVFIVEDNIGEAIHFHYDEIRCDLTVSEFLEVANICIKSASELLGIESFEVCNFDADFLNMYSYLIPGIEKTENSMKELGELKVYTKNILGIWSAEFLKKQSTVSKISQTYCEQTAQQKKIILFNDSPIIYWGHEFAAQKYRYYGNVEVPVIIVHINERYKVAKHSMIHDCWNRFITLCKLVKRKLKC